MLLLGLTSGQVMFIALYISCLLGWQYLMSLWFEEAIVSYIVSIIWHDMIYDIFRSHILMHYISAKCLYWKWGRLETVGPSSSLRGHDMLSPNSTNTKYAITLNQIWWTVPETKKNIWDMSSWAPYPSLATCSSVWYHTNQSIYDYCIQNIIRQVYYVMCRHPGVRSEACPTVSSKFSIMALRCKGCEAPRRRETIPAGQKRHKEGLKCRECPRASKGKNPMVNVNSCTS